MSAGEILGADALGVPRSGGSGYRLDTPRHADAQPPDRNALSPYLEFYEHQRRELLKSGVPEPKRRIGQRALLELLAWLKDKSDAQLAAGSPLNVYLRFQVATEREERDAAARQEAVKQKLDEYWEWAHGLWHEASRKYEVAGPAYLVTRNPLRAKSLDALVEAVLDWAYTHTQDPAFLERSPSEVALYLLAQRSTLATAVELGRGNDHLDYFPDLDRNRYTPGQLAVEILVGLLPGAGEVAMALEVSTGISITGHDLESGDRVLLAMASLLPFAPGILRGAEFLERPALLTGISLKEAQVLSRVASHLNPTEVGEIERVLRVVAKGGQPSAEDVALFRRIALRLEGPLAEVAEAVRKGARVPLLGSRVGASGAPLVLGSAEHMAQCWIDYQFRYLGRYKRFSYTVDPKWERLYRSILENKPAGGEFEEAVLRFAKYEKNTTMMVPPPGSELEGFIPDSVPGSSKELVWGQPYIFVEIKGRQDMALTGNLEAMLNYVKRYGGHIEVWFRSAQHPLKETRLTAPLRKLLQDLQNAGRATVGFYPP